MKFLIRARETAAWTSMTDKATWPVLAMRFLVILAALHTPSWIAASVFQGPRAEERPLLNLDLLLAAAIACISTAAGGVALLIAWAADLIRAAAKNYHFMSALDFVDAARFLDMLNVRTFLSASAFFISACLLLCAGVVLFQTRRSRVLAWPLLVAMFLSAGLDIANGSFHIFGLAKDSRIINLNFAGSPIWNVWRSERQNLLVSGPPLPMPNPSTNLALRDWQARHPRQTSMLVLVESMGLPRDKALQVWLAGRLETQRLLSRWTIRPSEDHFYGSTTSGELRTLCGLQGHYSRLDDQLASKCLPRELAASGITSVGIHGFGLRMFDRSHWWPKIGLTPWIWPAHVEGERPMNCNPAFPGICDSEVLHQAVIEAQRSARFVYALTLDTHLPLAPSLEPIPLDLETACREASATPSACRLIYRLGLVLEMLETSLAASASTPFLAVVGDHAPPFGEAINRDAFAADRVPLFVLTPRD